MKPRIRHETTFLDWVEQSDLALFDAAFIDRSARNFTTNVGEFLVPKLNEW